MSKPAKNSLGMAFLDVLSCALGAAIVLAVIFSIIRNPPTSPIPNEFILLEFTATMTPPVAREAQASFVTIVDGPGDLPPIPIPTDGKLITTEEGIQYQSWTGKVGKSSKFRVYLRVTQPSVGDYRFLPMLADLSIPGLNWQENEPWSARIWTQEGTKVLNQESSPNTPPRPGYPAAQPRAFEISIGKP